MRDTYSHYCKVFFYLASNYAQFALHKMIDDADFVDKFASTNQHNLKQAYQSLTKTLSEVGVEYVEGGAGFFVLISLRKYLRSNDWDAEMDLWRFLASDCKVVCVYFAY